MSSLVVDNRAALAGAPGFHALIVGVSTYPFLDGGAAPVPDPWDMGQLTTAATSAQRIREWLGAAHGAQLLPFPLATCRVLLSPSPGEPLVAGVGLPATLANFAQAATEWREDCKTDPRNVSLMYFAGHGVQRTTEDAVLCLEDFRRPAFGGLSHSISLANIRGGMAPTPEFPDIARTQFYFADACRTRPVRFAEFEKMGTAEIFDVSLEGEDDRCSPIYFAALSNHAALAAPGGSSLFSKAIIDCLDGEAGEPLDEDAQGNARWGVTVGSLNDKLSTFKIDALNREFMANQSYAPGGQFRPGTICFLAKPPTVRFRLEMDPPAASQVGRLTLSGTTNPPPIAPIAPHPFVSDLPGGMYRANISFVPPHPLYKDQERLYNLKPVAFSRKVAVI